MKKLLVIAIAMLGLILTGVAVSHAQPTAPASTRPAATRGRHCVSQAYRAPEGSDLAELPDVSAAVAAEAAATCYPTFAEAFQAATGAPSVDPNITPADVTEELLTSLAAMSAAAADPAAPQAPTSVIIGIDFSGSNYSGSTNTWWGAGSGCTTTSVYYYRSTAPSGWDNRVSSSRAYSGCAAAYHFEHPYWAGAVLRCNWCSSYGAMDNRTSSWLWYRSAPHY